MKDRAIFSPEKEEEEEKKKTVKNTNNKSMLGINNRRWKDCVIYLDGISSPASYFSRLVVLLTFFLSAGMIKFVYNPREIVEFQWRWLKSPDHLSVYTRAHCVASCVLLDTEGRRSYHHRIYRYSRFVFDNRLEWTKLSMDQLDQWISIQTALRAA